MLEDRVGPNLVFELALRGTVVYWLGGLIPFHLDALSCREKVLIVAVQTWSLIDNSMSRQRHRFSRLTDANRAFCVCVWGHFIQYMTTRWYFAARIIQLVCFAQFLFWKNEVGLWSGQVLPQYFKFVRCKTHLKVAAPSFRLSRRTYLSKSSDQKGLYILDPIVYNFP